MSAKRRLERAERELKRRRLAAEPKRLTVVRRIVGRHPDEEGHAGELVELGRCERTLVMTPGRPPRAEGFTSSGVLEGRAERLGDGIARQGT